MIEVGDLLNPATAVAMLKIHDFGMRPVKMICNIGYLLVEPLQRVA